ncbi:hypothetical protein LO771_27295 [Streptacidiphilus sp. ASG 303]|uniref:hypothetical protein n=1 Tax=Streptacidiphilus sp. ASG 303 TaxID=2896847 RepID=UPI001E412E8F|nr:hypothetical protein [Streptacidiphilus sp. ASG 303]MCD0485989.1 hypothetical protein [Streptacidiphilus sp. ASG 303]
MDNQIHLFKDDDGLAVIGRPEAVERFLAAEKLPSKDLGLPRLGPMLGSLSGAAHAASEIAANSGRWVKLTEQSAQAMKKYKLMKGPHDGVSRAVVMAKNGRIKEIVQFAGTPGSFLANPAILSGAAGLMAQLASQQRMEEIAAYLAVIDQKVEDVLRAQKDAVLADMIGAGLVLDEAMIVREQVGRVSEITWSRVQAAPMTIARTQAYALLQLDALAESMERRTAVGDLVKVSKEVESAAGQWLAVLARCFQLYDTSAVLELDRVLEVSPLELDQHRLALRAARQNRRELIAQSTGRLLARVDAAVGTANAKVLLHPNASPAVVQSGRQVETAVVDFHGRLGIESGRQSLDGRRWVDAAVETRDKVLETGVEGVNAAKRLGNETFDRARSVTGRLSDGVAGRVLRRRGGGGEHDAEG